MRTLLSLIVGGTGCIAFSACSSDPPETHVYNYKVYQKPGVKYVKRPTSSTSSYKVGGGGTRHVGGSDTAGGFRASE